MPASASNPIVVVLQEGERIEGRRKQMGWKTNKNKTTCCLVSVYFVHLVYVAGCWFTYLLYVFLILFCFSFLGVLPPSARCGSILPQARGIFIPLFRLAMYQYHRIPMLLLFGVFVAEFFCTCLIFLFLFSFPFFCVFRFCLSMCLGCCQMCRADPLKKVFLLEGRSP